MGHLQDQQRRRRIGRDHHPVRRFHGVVRHRDVVGTEHRAQAPQVRLQAAFELRPAALPRAAHRQLQGGVDAGEFVEQFVGGDVHGRQSGALGSHGVRRPGQRHGDAVSAG